MRRLLSPSTPVPAPGVATYFAHDDVVDKPIASHMSATSQRRRQLAPLSAAALAAATATRRNTATAAAAAAALHQQQGGSVVDDSNSGNSKRAHEGDVVWSTTAHKVEQLAMSTALAASTCSHVTLAGLTSASTQRTSPSPTSCALSLMPHTVQLSVGVGAASHNNDNSNNNSARSRNSACVRAQPYASFLLHADTLAGRCTAITAGAVDDVDKAVAVDALTTHSGAHYAAAAAATTTTTASRYTLQPVAVTAPLATYMANYMHSNDVDNNTMTTTNYTQHGDKDTTAAQPCVCAHETYSGDRRTPPRTDSYYSSSQPSPGSPPRVVHTARVTPVHMTTDAHAESMALSPYAITTTTTAAAAADAADAAADATTTTITTPSTATTDCSIRTAPTPSPLAGATAYAVTPSATYLAGTRVLYTNDDDGKDDNNNDNNDDDDVYNSKHYSVMLRYTCPTLAPQPLFATTNTTTATLTRSAAMTNATAAHAYDIHKYNNNSSEVTAAALTTNDVACGHAAAALRRARRLPRPAAHSAVTLYDAHAAETTNATATTTTKANAAMRASRANTHTTVVVASCSAAAAAAAAATSSQSLQQPQRASPSLRFVFPSQPPLPATTAAPPLPYARQERNDVYGGGGNSGALATAAAPAIVVVVDERARRLSRGVCSCVRVDDSAATRCTRRRAALAAVQAMLQ